MFGLREEYNEFTNARSLERDKRCMDILEIPRMKEMTRDLDGSR